MGREQRGTLGCSPESPESSFHLSLHVFGTPVPQQKLKQKTKSQLNPEVFKMATGWSMQTELCVEKVAIVKEEILWLFPYAHQWEYNYYTSQQGTLLFQLLLKITIEYDHSLIKN